MGKPDKNTNGNPDETKSPEAIAKLKAEKQAKADAKAIAHPFTLIRFHDLVEVVDGFINEVQSDRTIILQTLARAVGFSARYVHGDVLKGNKHFMMIPTETDEQRKEAGRDRKRCLADYTGDFAAFKTESKIGRIIEMQIKLYGQPRDQVEAAIRARVESGELDLDTITL